MMMVAVSRRRFLSLGAALDVGGCRECLRPRVKSARILKFGAALA